jgi:hypothetical protein
MKYTWINFLSSARNFFSKRFHIAIGSCFALTFGMAGPALAQTCPPANVGDTCPVTATAGLETGLLDLAFLKLDKRGQNGNGAMVDWGDMTRNIGLYRCFEPVAHPHECHIYGTHTYATPGTHQIVIHYNELGGLFGPGPEKTVGSTATISSVKDFVILSIGDSVASGEGDPVVEYSGRADMMQPNQGLWDDRGSNYNYPSIPDQIGREIGRACHRSLVAGPSQAARQFVASNKDTITGEDTITFAHLACSGATLSFVPEEERNASDLIDQLRIARTQLPRIDVLLISGGANNMVFRSEFYGILNNTDVSAGFGAVIARCIGGEFSQPCQDDGKFTTDINDSINGNPGRVLDGSGGRKFHFPGLQSLYQDLDKEIHCINPGDYLDPGDKDKPEPNCSEQQIPKTVLITEYFDPTHDASGNLFDLCWTIRKPTWAYLFASVMEQLNNQVHNSPWQVVGSIQNDFFTHGLCSSNPWVVNTTESLARQNDKNGSGHPNGDGQGDYRDNIHAAIVAYNVPITTASAAIGSTPYPFGTWTNQDVTVTLSATNAIKESGVKQTLYAVDDSANCQPVTWPRCSIYGGPFTIGTSGKHTVTFDSQNTSGWMGSFQNVQVWVDKNPPLSSLPNTMTIPQGESASYTINLGHFGWAGQTINLSCTTDAQLSQCTMLPTSVTLDATNSNASVATVVTTLTGGLPGQAALVQQNPFGPLGALRFLLAFTMAAFLVAMARALRAQRWVRVTHFATLALLFGWLSAGCNSAAQIPGTPRGAYTVTITGTSGMTTNTVQTKLIVK